MPHPIIEISELTQLVADHLLPDDRRSLVSLACTCRALEEQALSTLWSEQSSLETLIRSTLPPGILFSPQLPPQPTRAEWDKFRLYASWMRRLFLGPDPNVPEEVFRMISDNLPNGILFPGLRDLLWMIRSHIPPFYHIFLSPSLTVFSLSCSLLSDKILSSILSLIQHLKTLPLRALYLDCHKVSRDMESAFSSAVLQCGHSLKALFISAPLSDAAVQHIARLPNLTQWYVTDTPPRVSDLSRLSGAFPQLELLHLQSEASPEWLPLIGATAHRTYPKQESHMQAHRGPCQKLTTLECRREVPVDIAFVAPIMLFHGLVYLTLHSSCSFDGGCTFNLTDDDTEEIATALPRLKHAILGSVCYANSCQTTVSSLVSFSTHCENLGRLEIHFNTTNLRDDLDSISADPRLDNLPPLTKRAPLFLVLSEAPIQISGEDIGPVVTGFLRIFPSLKEFIGDDPALDKLNAWLVLEE